MVWLVMDYGEFGEQGEPDSVWTSEELAQKQADGIYRAEVYSVVLDVPFQAGLSRQ